MKNNYYGTNKYKPDNIINILSITGPVLLGNTMCNMLNIAEFSINEIYNKNEINLDNCNIKILNFTMDGYITHKNNKIIKVKNSEYKQTEDYKELFKNKNLYN